MLWHIIEMPIYQKVHNKKAEQTVDYHISQVAYFWSLASIGDKDNIEAPNKE